MQRISRRNRVQYWDELCLQKSILTYHSVRSGYSDSPGLPSFPVRADSGEVVVNLALPLRLLAGYRYQPAQVVRTGM